MPTTAGLSYHRLLFDDDEDGGAPSPLPPPTSDEMMAKKGASFDTSATSTLLTSALTASSSSFDFTATSFTADGFPQLVVEEDVENESRRSYDEYYSYNEDDDTSVPTQQSYWRKNGTTKGRFRSFGKLLRSKSFDAADKSKSRLLSAVTMSVRKNKLPPTSTPPPYVASVVATSSCDNAKAETDIENTAVSNCSAMEAAAIESVATKDEIQKQNSEKRKMFKAAKSHSASASTNDSGPSLWCTNIQVLEDDVNASSDVHDDMSVIDVESTVVPFEPFVSRPWEEKKRNERVAKQRSVCSEYSCDVKVEATAAGADDIKSTSTSVRGRSTIDLLKHALQDKPSPSTLRPSKSMEIKSVDNPSNLSRSCNTAASKESIAVSKAATTSPPKPVKRHANTKPTPEGNTRPKAVVAASRPTPEKPTISRGSQPTPEKVVIPLRRTSERSKFVNRINRLTSPPSMVDNRCTKSESKRLGSSNSMSAFSSTSPPPFSNKDPNTTGDAAVLTYDSAKIKVDMNGMVKARENLPQPTLHSSASVVSELTHDENASVSYASVSSNRLKTEQASRKSSKGRIEKKDRIEKKAAIVIQSAFRGYSAYHEFLVLLGQIVTIQSIWRRLVAVRELSQRKLAMVSATKIQSQWRAFVVWEGYRGALEAAMTIQNLVRQRSAKAHLNTLVQATAVVQKMVRGRIARREYREAVCGAAIQYFIVTLRATVKIQAFTRMVAERKRYCAIRTAVAIIAAIQAALKIQAFARMLAVRKRYCTFQHAVVTVQALSRMSATKTRYVLAVGSIVRIQSWARRVETERAYETMHRSATVIQCLTRRARARQQLTAARVLSAQSLYQKQQKAAIIVQSTVRRSIAMRDYGASLRAVALLQTVAAVTIQKLWRGYIARDHYIAARDEAGKTAALASRRSRRAVREDFVTPSSTDGSDVSNRDRRTGWWQMTEDEQKQESSECRSDKATIAAVENLADCSFDYYHSDESWQRMKGSQEEEASDCISDKESIAAVENVTDDSFDDYHCDEIECVLHENEDGARIIASADATNESALNKPDPPCHEAYEVILDEDEGRKRCVVATPLW